MPKVINLLDRPVGEKETRTFKYVGRPSDFGNPFFIGRDGTREEVIKKYSEWIEGRPVLQERIKNELKGSDLGCFCAPEPCHADILLKIANE